jgi:hypothetical protein
VGGGAMTISLPILFALVYLASLLACGTAWAIATWWCDRDNRKWRQTAETEHQSGHGPWETR